MLNVTSTDCIDTWRYLPHSYRFALPACPSRRCLSSRALVAISHDLEAMEPGQGLSERPEIACSMIEQSDPTSMSKASPRLM